ncbi:MAG TPA: response regulator transcription factor [Terriglobia bacterium]|nr:response regulator transcription factor [Terriglobia bacterium]
MMNPNILFVEDEEALRMTVGDLLRKEGYAVDYAADGDDGLQKATTLPFDLIILDVMLPGRHGFVICEEIRRAGLITPILMLTARSRTEDKVKGLRTGADDYVTKPFNMQELLARVEALLRRTPSNPDVHTGIDHFGPIRIDRRGTSVTREGIAVNLSAREFQLLRYFVDHPGATLSRKELLTQVWGYSAGAFTRTVDVHVASLRQKLETDPRQPRFILTIPRLGYKFSP